MNSNASITEPCEQNILMLQTLDLKSYVVTLRQIEDGKGCSRKFSYGRGYHISQDKIEHVQANVQYLLRDDVAVVYCIDKDTLFASDPALVKRLQEMKWARKIKVVEVADKTDLIKKTTDAFCNLKKSSFFDRLFN